MLQAIRPQKWCCVLHRAPIGGIWCQFAPLLSTSTLITWLRWALPILPTVELLFFPLSLINICGETHWDSEDILLLFILPTHVHPSRMIYFALNIVPIWPKKTWTWTNNSTVQKSMSLSPTPSQPPVPLPQPPLFLLFFVSFQKCSMHTIH